MEAKALVGLVAVGAMAVGFLARPAFDWVANQMSGGPNVRCAAEGSICLGDAPSKAFAFLDDDIGGVLDISCGYTTPGAGALSHLTTFELMTQDCSSPEYVVSFSNGRRLINLWVDNDRIVRIDDYPRHSSLL